MNWNVIADNWQAYADGTELTVALTVASLAIAFVLALPLALARNAANPLLRNAVAGYTLLFRGTPLLVQLFLIYFGLAQFKMLRASLFWPWLSSPLVCALITFILNTTAYTTEIFAGSIRHLPPGDIEAARAYGLSRVAVARRIVLPAMLTRSLSLYGNETIMMLHATSLASTVTLLEVTGVARRITLDSYILFEPYVTAAAIYLVLTLLLIGGFHAAERRWAAYLRPSPR